MDAIAWFDLAVAIVLLITTIRGAIRGVFWELATVGAIVLCFAFAQQLSARIAPHVPLGEPLNRWVSLLALYVLFSFVSFSVARVLRGFVEKLRFREYDRHLGAIVGLLKGVVLLLLVTCFLVTIVPASRDVVLRSRSGRIAAVILEAIHPALPEGIHEILHPYLHNLDVADRSGHVPSEGPLPPPPHTHTPDTTGHAHTNGSSSGGPVSPGGNAPPPAGPDGSRNGQATRPPTASPPQHGERPETEDGVPDQPRPAPPALDELLWRIFQIGVGAPARPSSAPGVPQASADQTARDPHASADETSDTTEDNGRPGAAAGEDVIGSLSEWLAQILVDSFLNRIDDPEVRASWRAAWERATPEQRRELVERLQDEPPEKAAAEFSDWVRQVR